MMFNYIRIEKGLFSLSRLKVQFRLPNVLFKVQKVDTTNFFNRQLNKREFAIFTLQDNSDLLNNSKGANPICFPSQSLRLTNGQRLISLRLRDKSNQVVQTHFQLVANRRCKQLAHRYVNRRRICAERLDDRDLFTPFEPLPLRKQLLQALQTLGKMQSIRSRLASSTRIHEASKEAEILDDGEPLFAKLNNRYHLFGLHVKSPYEKDMAQVNLHLFFNARRPRQYILQALKN